MFQTWLTVLLQVTSRLLEAERKKLIVLERELALHLRELAPRRVGVHPEYRVRPTRGQGAVLITQCRNDI